MTVAVEPDTRGIDALLDKTDDNVERLPALLFDQLMAEMADQFPAAPLCGPELEFDEEPWRALPDMEALEHLWQESPPLVTMLRKISISFAGVVEDLPGFLAQQRLMADIELGWIKERQALDEQHGTQSAADDSAGSEEPASGQPADSVRGGQDLPGEPENGDQVGEGGQAGGDPDAGRAPKVPRRRRSGAAGNAAAGR